MRTASSTLVAMGAVEIVLILVFCAWGIASVAFQFDCPKIRQWSYRDCFGLLPLWTFFAPSPGQTDYHLVIRDEHADGTISSFREIPLSDTRTVYSWFWNPQKRGIKVLSDVVQMLIELSSQHRGSRAVILLSTPYALVLNAVMKEAAPPPAVRRQFVIAQTRGFYRDGMPEVLLRSAFHRLA